MYIISATISNIFLLNYLIAILQTVQAVMYENGDYYSISYQFRFINKYIIALEELSGYEELILLPPPLNFLYVPLLIISPSKKLMFQGAQWFKFFIFWAENFFFYILFFLYLQFISILIYFKKIWEILNHLHGLFKFLLVLAWITVGPIYLLYVNFQDLIALSTILCSQ